MLDDLAVLCERTGKLIGQARCRVNGGQPDGATRLVSLHEPDARPISKGRLGKPVEFGYKAQVVDNVDGIIIDHCVHIGNPSDTGLLRPAMTRVKEPFGIAPVLVTADRGYWDSTIEADLTRDGVATVVIPRTGTLRPPSPRRRARPRRSDSRCDRSPRRAARFPPSAPARPGRTGPRRSRRTSTRATRPASRLSGIAMLTVLGSLDMLFLLRSSRE